MQFDFKDFTVRQIEEIIGNINQLCCHTGLTIEQLNWLMYYMCVKDEDNHWHGLSYSTYKVIFDGDRIWLKLNNPLYNERGGLIPLKDMYLVKGAFPSEQEKVSEHIVFPKYTGYHKVLNGEIEDFE